MGHGSSSQTRDNDIRIPAMYVGNDRVIIKDHKRLYKKERREMIAESIESCT